jgi:putative phosphoribosyl transferase
MRSSEPRRFTDRQAAGRQLAEFVAARLGASGEAVVVLALPRGGMPVAVPVADALGAPLDVLVVRKLGAPGHEELAMGAIGEGDVLVLNAEVIEALGIDRGTVDAVRDAERAELARRVQRYRHGRAMVSVRDATAVIVDDGIATGATSTAAVRVARALGARRIVLATPVATTTTIAALAAVADDVIAVQEPEDLVTVGAWYDDFTQVSDDEVVRLLQR